MDVIGLILLLPLAGFVALCTLTAYADMERE